MSAPTGAAPRVPFRLWEHAVANSINNTRAARPNPARMRAGVQVADLESLPSLPRLLSLLTSPSEQVQELTSALSAVTGSAVSTEAARSVALEVVDGLASRQAQRAGVPAETLFGPLLGVTRALVAGGRPSAAGLGGGARAAAAASTARSPPLRSSTASPPPSTPAAAGASNDAVAPARSKPSTTKMRQLTPSRSSSPAAAVGGQRSPFPLGWTTERRGRWWWLGRRP